jgi:hypothetical protein
MWKFLHLKTFFGILVKTACKPKWKVGQNFAEATHEPSKMPVNLASFSCSYGLVSIGIFCEKKTLFSPAIFENYLFNNHFFYLQI